MNSTITHLTKQQPAFCLRHFTSVGTVATSLFLCLSFICAIASTSAFAQANDSDTSDLSHQIEQLVFETVNNAVEAQYSNASYTVTAQKIANLTQLRACEQLSAEIRSKNLYGRVPVYIRCELPSSWSLYASANVQIDVPVWVTQRALPRGAQITPDVLERQVMPLHQLRKHTITRIEDAVGKITRRPIAAGRALNLNELTTPPVVSKGERVHILATSGRVSIASYGVALASGQIGDQIQVRNESSKRIIQPWILGPGKVGSQPPDLLSSP